VHKPDDGGPSANDQMFSSTYKALADGELVTIFPEGITVDDPSIAHIKTGSARIALGARASGVEGLRLVSAGIHYENKAALRSDVFIDIGWEIDLDAEIGRYAAEGEPQDASNREAVRALTDDMEERLRRAAPDFEDWATAHSLSKAAGVALRDPIARDADVSMTAPMGIRRVSSRPCQRIRMILTQWGSMTRCSWPVSKACNSSRGTSSAYS
jgi:hypothetical protein